MADDDTVTLGEVNRTLAALITRVDRHITQQNGLCEFMERVDSHMKREETFIFGDVDKPGLNIRVDRLEQDFLNRRWHFRTLWGAWVVALLASLWNILLRHNK